jgi:hypothetical protein
VNAATFRALSIVPALLFVAYLARAAAHGAPAESLWICHVSNLVLAVGIGTERAFIAGPAVAWIVVGIPLWAVDACEHGSVAAVSVFSHIGGLAVGLYALSRLRLRYNPWLPALLFFTMLQQLCRWFTPAAANVNLAHAPYGDSNVWVAGYWTYWIATTIGAAAALWLIGRLLSLWFREETPCR